MRRTCAVLALSLVLAAGLGACKGEEGKRESYAEETLSLEMPKCRTTVSGHEMDKLSVFCEDADMEYIATKALPAVAKNCGKLKELGFTGVEVFGPRGSGQSWSGYTDVKDCGMPTSAP